MRMAQSVAFAVQNVELLAAGLASDSAARSEARRRLQSRREHAYARDAAETLALAMEDAEEYEPSAVLLQDDAERIANIETYTTPDFRLGASRPTHYGFPCAQVQTDPGGRFRALGPISTVQDGFDGVPDGSRAGSFWMCRFFAIGALSVSPLSCPGRL